MRSLHLPVSLSRISAIFALLLIALLIGPQQQAVAKPLSLVTVDGVNNGNFESGNNGDWSIENNLPQYPTITTQHPSNIEPFRDYVAWLGSIANRRHKLRQRIPLPSEATSLTLEFSYYIGSDEDNCYNDELFITNTIEGVGSDQVFFPDFLCREDNTGGWKSYSRSINGAGADAITLEFYVTTNGSKISNFVIDNVRVMIGGVKEPKLTFSSTKLDFTSTGGFVPSGQNLNISKQGYPATSWTATANKSWIVLSKTSGTFGQGNSSSYTTIRVTVNPLNQPITTQTGRITIQASGAIPSTYNIDVSMQVTPPEIRVTPSQLTFEATAGDTVTSQRVDVDFVGNTTTFDASWTVAADADWLTLSKSSGSGDSFFYVGVKEETLTPREEPYIGEITVTPATGQQMEIRKIPVQFTLRPGNPVLQVTPNSLDFSAVLNKTNPLEKQVIIQNAGDGILQWQATTTADWLVLNKNSGTTINDLSTVTVSADVTDLQPGSYDGQLIVTGPNNQQHSISLALTLIEPNGGVPVMRVGPPVLSYIFTVGQGSGAQTFTVENIGDKSLTWEATASPSWVQLSQTNGTAPTTVNVTLDTTGLSPGSHTGQITVTGSEGTVRTVDVLASVRKPPTLAVDGYRMVFSSFVGDTSPLMKKFYIRNSGDGQFNWNATENIPWLSLDRAGGVAPTTVEAQIDQSGLGEGMHEGAFDVTSPTAQESPRNISAKIYTLRGPQLSAFPQALNFYAVSGKDNPAPQMIGIFNDGFGDMQWQASDGAAWLNLSSNSGSVGKFSSQQVEVAVDAAGLTPQEEPYVGQIEVDTSNGQGGPQTITTELIVWSPARYCRIADGGEDWAVYSSQVKIKIKEAKTTFTDDGGCDLSGKLEMNLSHNKLFSVNFSAHVDPDNNLVASDNNPVTFELVKDFKIKSISGFSINENDGLVVDNFTLQFPAWLGGETETIDGRLQFGPSNTITEFDVDDFNWGQAVTFRQNHLKIRTSTDRGYIFVFSSKKVDITVKGSPPSSASGATLVINDRGIHSGSVSSFKIDNVAGLTLHVYGPRIEGDNLKISRAKLQIPELWGGSEASLYNVSISKNGNLSVGGGKFNLPEIDAGDGLRLMSLSGEFKERSGGGYEITAAGAFGMPGLQDNDSCRINASVTLYTGPNGSSVLEIHPPDNEPVTTVSTAASDISAQGLALREVTVGLRCYPGVPIGTTSFSITGVEGTITLTGNIESISVKLWIESDTRFGSVPLVSAVPQATLWPSPFKMRFDTSVYIVGREVTRSITEFEARRFHSELTIKFVVIHGGMSVDAGKSGGKFYFTGSGWAEVLVERGYIVDKCAFGKCLRIPDSTQRAGRVDAYADLEKISGSINILGYRAGFAYNYQSGNISISNRAITLTSLTSQDIKLMQQGQLTAASAEQVSVEPGTVSVNTRVKAPFEGQIQATSVISDYSVSLQSDVIFALVQPADGNLEFSIIRPNGSPQYQPTQVSVNSSQKQIVFIVPRAEPGDWQMQVTGDTDNTDYYIYSGENSAPPSFTGNPSQIRTTNNPDTPQVEWRVLSADPNTTINIYAMTGPMTTTVPAADTTPPPDEPNNSIDLATPLPTNNTLQTHDLSDEDEDDWFVFSAIMGDTCTVRRVNDSVPLFIYDEEQHPIGDLYYLPLTLDIEQTGPYYIQAVTFSSGVVSYQIAIDCEKYGGSLDQAPRFGGVPVAENIPTGNGDRSYNLDLSQLPSGIYTFWIEARNSQGLIKRTHLLRPDSDEPTITLDHSQTFPTQWEPTIEADVNIKNNEMLVKWDSLQHPDLDEYHLRIRTADVLSPTVDVTREIPVGYLETGQSFVSMIEPGQDYHISIGAKDIDTDKQVWSPETTIPAPKPDFILFGEATGIQVGAGDAAQAIPLTLELSSDMPYPVSLAVDKERLADGLDVSFEPEIVQDSGNVTAFVSATGGTYPGRYALPIIARSGTIEHRLTLSLEVVEGSGSDDSGRKVYLPLIVK